MYIFLYTYNFSSFIILLLEVYFLIRIFHLPHDLFIQFSFNTFLRLRLLIVSTLCFTNLKIIETNLFFLRAETSKAYAAFRITDSSFLSCIYLIHIKIKYNTFIYIQTYRTLFIRFLKITLFIFTSRPAFLDLTYNYVEKAFSDCFKTLWFSNILNSTQITKYVAMFMNT